MARPDARHYGYDLRRAAGIRSARTYAALTRMLEQGWADDGQEEQEHMARRGKKIPPRRYYLLTGEGKANLAHLLSGAGPEVRPRSFLRRPAQRASRRGPRR